MYIVSLHLQLINLKCAGNDDMIEMVMNSLLGRLVDSSHQVRMLCIRGLGNVASNEKQQMDKNMLIKNGFIKQTIEFKFITPKLSNQYTVYSQTSI